MRRTEQRKTLEQEQRERLAMVQRLRENPAECEARLADYLQTIPASILIAALTGGASIPNAIKREIASRGLGHDGEWVGFEKAREHWGVR